MPVTMSPWLRDLCIGGRSLEIDKVDEDAANLADPSLRSPWLGDHRMRAGDNCRVSSEVEDEPDILTPSSLLVR